MTAGPLLVIWTPLCLSKPTSVSGGQSSRPSGNNSRLPARSRSRPREAGHCCPMRFRPTTCPHRFLRHCWCDDKRRRRCRYWCRTGHICLYWCTVAIFEFTEASFSCASSAAFSDPISAMASADCSCRVSMSCVSECSCLLRNSLALLAVARLVPRVCPDELIGLGVGVVPSGRAGASPLWRGSRDWSLFSPARPGTIMVMSHESIVRDTRDCRHFVVPDLVRTSVVVRVR